ncbi:unnamed protein product [Sphenostylis stenocarpa]|uniref:Uncharacterized protein n=1 Tax=Sphenostylis stenocarpa TaxID=92480 RepID=A0AA86V883_9FABA|nr:unnamed protein product [Sphenostylis stenocarpa]
MDGFVWMHYCQKFFLQGRFIFGLDVRSLALTIFLIVAPVTVFCVFVARKLMDSFSDHWGISIMAVAVVFTVYFGLWLAMGANVGRSFKIDAVGYDDIHFMQCEVLVLPLLTSGRDPGIIPRNAHPPEPEGLDSNLVVGAGQTLSCGCLGLRRLKSMAFQLSQTTYENFRYRYDRQANPYNKGVLNNFKEIFSISIPPSKNNFRATVPKEPALPTRSVGGGYMNQNIGKAGEDTEMGRKTVWDIAAGIDDSEAQLNNNRVAVKDGELSPEIRTTVDDTDRAAMHPRRSSWGRKSGSWEMSPEVLALAARVGEPNRVTGDSSSSLTHENRLASVQHRLTAKGILGRVSSGEIFIDCRASLVG